MSTAVAQAPTQGTIFDATGKVVRHGIDPRLAKVQSFFGAMPGGYNGARSDRRALQEWSPLPQSPDADSIGDLPTLRGRVRDLVRNAPLAAGAISTVVTNAVGTGLRPQPRVDTAYLTEKYGVTEDQADKFERDAARLWGYHSAGRFFDVAGLDTHEQLQAKALRAVLEGGDIFALRRRKKRPGALFAHCVQLIEADLVCNPDMEMDREGFAGGVESDPDGAQVAIRVASRYPYDLSSLQPLTWKRIPVRGAASGERLVRHLAWRRRIKQSRGVPYLATVIELFKTLDRYGEYEMMAALVTSLFTVFIKSDVPGNFFDGLDATTAAGIAPQSVGLDVPAPRKMKLASGGVFELGPGESIETANAQRPNANFAPFVEANLAILGAGIEIPAELLIKQFRSSYSAARASRLEFWKFVTPVRGFMAADFCQPDYEDIISEAVALGMLDAPGFMDDPLARYAWLGCWWIGPAPGQIDEKGEVDAAIARINAGLSTLEEETAQLTGGSWEQNHGQAAKERKQRIKDGLTLAQTPAEVAMAQEANGTAGQTLTAAQRDQQDKQTQANGRNVTRAEMIEALELAMMVSGRAA